MEELAVVHPHNGEFTGEILNRKELHEKGLWCRTTNVLAGTPNTGHSF